MKKILMSLLTLAILLTAITTNVFAAEVPNEISPAYATMPDSYTTYVGGKVKTFSGSSTTYTFTVSKSYSSTVYVEFMLSDPGNQGSYWQMTLKNSSGVVKAKVLILDGAANEDYEPIFGGLSSGTYTVTVNNVSGASSSTKSASVLLWTK